MSVNPIYVLDLAAQHARWATVRQTVITGNIANVHTSGYVAQDIKPFSAVMSDVSDGGALAATNPGHIAGGADNAQDAAATFDVEDTGQKVALDKELMKSDETNKGFALDMAIVRTFHRMLLLAARTGG